MSYLEKRISSQSGFPTREQVEEEEKKFDFTRGQNSDYNYSMFGAAGSPPQGASWSFIDVINPKKHALAFAKELDNKRGIPIDTSKDSTEDNNDNSDNNNSNTDTNTNTNTNGFIGDGSSQSTIRRLPSGAKPTSTGHTIQATTPVKSNGNNANLIGEQNLSDVVGQSTPLTLEKNQRPESKNYNDIRDYDGLIKETHLLHEEIAQLKERLLHSESQKVEKDSKIVELSELLRSKSSSVTQLQNSLKEGEKSVDSLQEELNELRGEQALERKKNKTELDKKLQLIREMEQSSKQEIQDLKEIHQKEQDSLSQRLKQLDTNWHDTLEKEKQKLMADIDGLETEYDNKTIELQNSIKDKTQQLEVSSEALRDNEQKINDLRNILHERDDVLADKSIELEKLKKDFQGKNTELVEKTKELQASQSASREKEQELKNDLDSRGYRMNELSQKIQYLQNDFKSKELQIAELTQTIQNLQNDLKLKNDGLSELSDHLKEKDQMVKHKDEEVHRKIDDIKALETKFSGKNDEFLQKSKEFDLVCESKKEISTSKTHLEQQLRRCENQNKKFEDRLQRQRMEHNEQMKKLQQTLEDEKKIHDTLKNKMKEVDRFARYIEDLKLFETKLGGVIVDTFKKNHETRNLDFFFISNFQNITGFHTKEHDKSSQEMKTKIDTLELKNQELLIQIEHQWKSKVENEHQELQQHKTELEKLHEKFKAIEDKLATTQAKLEIYQEEKAVLLKEKEAVFQSNVALNEEMTNYKSTSLNKDQERFLELISKVEEQTEFIGKLQDEIKEVNVIKNQLENESKVLHNDFGSQSVELKGLQSSMHKLQGDPSRKITFEVARRSRPDINSSTYGSLLVSKVDSIDMVELQNIVKNLILLLDIPFDKLTKKSPLVAIYLKYERPIFSHFANRLHYQMFNEPIDMKRFANDAYAQYTEDHDMRAIKHPLQSCLDNLYERLISKI